MISDELQECQSCFRAERQPFDIKFYLEHVDDQMVLLLQLKNKHTPEYYQLKIDRFYIQQQNDLSFCFQTPQDLFYTLTELFQELDFSIEGTIAFEMKLNASKLKKKTFKIQLNKYQLNQQEFMNIKFEKLTQQVKTELIERQIRIKTLAHKNNQQEMTINHLKEEFLQIKKDQDSLSLENKRQYFKINTLTKQKQMQKQQIIELKTSLNVVLNKLNCMQFYCFYENPHWHHFGVYKTQDSFKIVRKDSDSSWCSFIYNIPLDVTRINGFKIRQSKTNSKHIMFGIGTKQLFGLANSYKDPLSIAYSSNSGNIWQGGQSKKVGSPINDGQIVTIDIDLPKGRISWQVDQQKMAKTVIAETLSKKQLYLFIHTYNTEDELQFLIF